MVPLLAGRLRGLQGVCVPALHACGYWLGGALFVLATAAIKGQYLEYFFFEGGREIDDVLANARQVR